MSGKRRIGGNMYALDGEGESHDAAPRPKLYSPGLRRGYQVRFTGRFYEVWYVEYHQGEAHTAVTKEQRIGIFSNEREAELAARRN